MECKQSLVNKILEKTNYSERVNLLIGSFFLTIF
nr:MAG TPA: hypothetical protein [Caudoviricetes sp.]